jgi:hypothetical protein
MSRSGYTDYWDDGDNRAGLWRGAIKSAFRGKRGQALLRDMLSAFDTMPSKRLIADDLVTEDGECCALGAVALCRKLDVSEIEPIDRDDVAAAFDIAPVMAAEIAYENDEGRRGYHGGVQETPEERFIRMREWVAAQVKS